MRTLYIAFFTLFIACQETKQGAYKKAEADLGELDSAKIRKQYYENLQKNKQFIFEPIGSCTDALEDTLYERRECIIEKKIQSDSSFIIELKFKDVCCQEFMGDFSIKDGKFVCEIEQINDFVCACICWYRYRLRVAHPIETNLQIKVNIKVRH